MSLPKSKHIFSIYSCFSFFFSILFLFLFFLTHQQLSKIYSAAHGITKWQLRDARFPFAARCTSVRDRCGRRHSRKSGCKPGDCRFFIWYDVLPLYFLFFFSPLFLLYTYILITMMINKLFLASTATSLKI